MDGDAGKGSVRGPSQVLACSAIAVVCSLFHAISFGEEKAIGEGLTRLSDSSFMGLSDFLHATQHPTDIFSTLCLTNMNITKTDFNESRHESMLACSIIAHYATCLADTLASELGILSKSEPYLLTNPRRKVPPGTNGGVTTDGFFYSFVGGVLIGLGALFMDICSGIRIQPVQMMLFSGGCGLVGSILDSLLGATVQATYYDQEKKLIYCRKEDAPKAVEHLSGSNVLTNAQVNLVSVLLTCMFGGLFFGPMIF